MLETFSDTDTAEKITERIQYLTENNLLRLANIVDEMILRQDICHLIDSGAAEIDKVFKIKTIILGESALENRRVS